jgi:signal transduction histidine kinase
MKQRLLRFLTLATLPWIFLLGIVTNFLLRDIFSNNLTSSWLESVPYTSGMQALVCLLAVGFLISTAHLSARIVEPFDDLTAQVNAIAMSQPLQAPRETGIADLDRIVSALHVTAGDARRRLDAERTLAADVSHQLRSPLTALSLRLEQIAIDTENTRVHEDANAALGQVDRLVRLVEGLLTTWRSTSDRELSMIEIPEFLERNIVRWSARFEANGRALKFKCPSELTALGTREVQDLVLSVLLENSLQHGAGITTVTAKDYQSWVLIEVADEGEGIAEDIQGTLMSKGSTTGGNGLGLAWARTQVASDGGRLELRSIKPAVFGIFLMSAKKYVSPEVEQDLIR